MMASDAEAEVAEDIDGAFAGWRDRVEHPERYRKWPIQAAHLHCTYDIPKKRACVVALRQAGASNDTIAAILDRSKGTVSEHFSTFQDDLKTAEDLLDVMGPHAYDYDDPIDRDNWLPLGRVAYDYTDEEGLDGSRRIKLFVERLGNAVDNEYLLVDRKQVATENTAETETTVTRSPVSGAATVISKLSRPFRYDIDRVGHLALVFNGFFDPKGRIDYHTDLRDTRIIELAERLADAPEPFYEEVDRLHASEDTSN